MTYELRPALWEDNPFLEALYADVHGSELASLSLPAPALAQLVALRFKAERMAFAAQFPDSDHNVIWIRGHRIGRIILNEAPAEIQLIDLALLALFRGAGVGTGILEQLQAHAAERNLPLRLSVHPQNPATRLFHRLGFINIGDQTNTLQMEWIARP
ncbi:MAG TPA: GNAT family N-acetyltransferase [Acidobacteriaceae bacterium]